MNDRIARSSKRRAVDLQAEGRRTWKAFEKVSARITGFDEIKQSRYRFAFDGLRDGSSLYTYFPFLFIDAFPELTRRELRSLSVMTLLYLYHILLDDALMDLDDAVMNDDGVPPRTTVLLSNAYSLAALRILDELVAPRPLPWRTIQQLHRQYSTAILLEGERHNRSLKPYLTGDMVRILSRKSAMAKLIPVSLCVLANRDECLAPLTRSFDLYYVGDQMFDDFRDWKKDLRAGRYSYLLTRVVTACNLQEKIESLDADQSVQLVGKHFYLSGIAEAYLNEIIGYWEQSNKQVQSLNCPQWVAFLNDSQAAVRRIQSELVYTTRPLLVQEQKYDYKLVGIERDETPIGQAHEAQSVSYHIASAASTVSEAGRRAVEFLRKCYKPGIGFEDFVVFKAPLPVWVSAYVGIALLEWIENEATRTGTQNHSLKAMMRQLAGDLIRSQSKTGWAPTAHAPTDADTTAWVTRFLLQKGSGHEQDSTRGARGMLGFRRPDGGFCTYRPESLGEGFAAYCESHVEVTAVVLEALISAGLETNDEVVENALIHIKEKQDADGLWQAYWWDGQMYATYHCLRALQATGESLPDRLRTDLISTIARQQGKDGSFGHATAGRNLAFETALALRSLLLINRERAGSDVVERGITWLLNYQCADGSWASRPMMRVPDGHDRSPWSTREWKLDKPNGVGILVGDQNRSFTTATVLAALTDFLSYAGDRHLIATLKLAFQAVA